MATFLALMEFGVEATFFVPHVAVFPVHLTTESEETTRELFPT